MTGFGSRIKTIVPPSDPIDIGGLSGATHMAFPMPDDGIITSMSAFINVVGAPLLDSTIYRGALFFNSA